MGSGSGDARGARGPQARVPDRGGRPGNDRVPSRAAERPGSSTPAPNGGARREEPASRSYDPRREARRQLLRVPVPADVDPRDLDPEVRQELRSLAKDTADLTAQHLVMTGRLLDDDPQAALAHARAAGALAGRVGPVREAVGLAAYAAGEWAEALSELRAARRLTGRADHLAVLADCERALGRPERALAVLQDPDVPKLEQATRVELVIVVAGARRDLGQADAAVLLLQSPARATTARRPWATRLWYAYADALLVAGRDDEAREWFAKAAEQDGQGETDAMERLLELDGVVLEDLQAGHHGDDEDDEEPDPVDLTALLAQPPAGGPTSPDGGPVDGEPAGERTPGPHAEPGAGPEAGAAAAPGGDAAAGVPARRSEPLFSDERPVAAAAERARAQVPAVSFAPPPDAGEAGHAEDPERAGHAETQVGQGEGDDVH